MTTTAFLQRFDSFPIKIKEDISTIADYLLFEYLQTVDNERIKIALEGVPLSAIELNQILATSKNEVEKGQVLTTEQAKNIAKTWRKK